MSFGSSRSQLGQLDQNIFWQVEKCPVPRIWRSVSNSNGTRQGNLALFAPQNRRVTVLTWCGALIPLLLSSLFLCWFRSVLSFFIQVNLIEKLRLHLLLWMQLRHDFEMKWRMSCWEPPVVKAEKRGGGRGVNNELLDHLCGKTWPWAKARLSLPPRNKSYCSKLGQSNRMETGARLWLSVRLPVYILEGGKYLCKGVSREKKTVERLWWYSHSCLNAYWP